MKQFLRSTLMIFAAVMLFACDNETPTNKPGHKNNEFSFEHIIVKHTEINVDICPKDKDMEYIVLLSQPQDFIDRGIDTREELLADDLAYLKSLAQGYGISVYDFLKSMGWLVKGDKRDYHAINLYPETEYVVYCYGVVFDGDNYEATTPVNYEVIKTSAPKMINPKFDVTYTVENNNVKIEVSPKDYNGYYYAYIIPEGDPSKLYIGLDGVTDEVLQHYRNYTFDKFNDLINNVGTPVEFFCYKGDVTIEQRLMPYTYYQIALFAVSNDEVPILMSSPFVTYFSTEGVAASDLTVDIKVSDITPYTAQLTLTPSNNDEEYACVFLSRDQVPQFDDNEIMLTIINNFDPAIFEGGHSEKLMPLMPNTEYSVLAFGINSGLPTTQLFRYDFTSASAAEGSITVESIDIVKLFDAEAIVALDSNYADALAECSCVAVVEMKTSAPTDKVYFWWYEQWMMDEYSEEAFLEDLLLYAPTSTVQLMDMYYSEYISDKFFFVGMAEDENGNLSPIYYGDMFTLSKDQCDPAEEFFQYVNTLSATTFVIAR